MAQPDPPANPTPSPAAPPSPLHAFTQGVGTIFQFTGVTLFLVSMVICCGSSLLGKDAAQRRDLTRIGWFTYANGSAPGSALGSALPLYSAQRAISISVALGLVLGMALAGLGLGMQATRRSAPLMAVATTAIGAALWLTQAVFFAQILRSPALTILSSVLCIMLIVLAGLAIAAMLELRRSPPPAGYELLPADYKTPYSHLHARPPEERLAAELEERRRRLDIEQKELDALERRLRRKRDG